MRGEFIHIPEPQHACGPPRALPWRRIREGTIWRCPDCGEDWERRLYFDSWLICEYDPHWVKLSNPDEQVYN